GRSMALGTASLLITIFIVRPVAKIAAAMGTILCGFLVIMSGARTSWVVTFAILLAVPIFVLLQPNRFSRSLRIAMLGLTVVVGAVLLAFTYQYALTLIGRDETLSGRTHLWDIAIHTGVKRLALGAGYRAFWTENGASEVYAQTSIGGGYGAVGHGHNGYLDTWLEIGAVGFAAFLLVLGTTVLRVVNHLTQTRDATAVWLAMALGHMVLYAATVQVLMQQSEINWVILVATLFWLTPNRAKVRYPAFRGPSAAPIC